MGGQLDGGLLRSLLVVGRFLRSPQPRVCIETGTYLGDSTRLLASIFTEVHTIELSPKYHGLAQENLKDVPGIRFYLGDSGLWVGKIIETIQEPVVVFLDAHWAGGDTACGDEEVPLLRELQSLAPRCYPDVLIIDDVRLIGRAGFSGSESNAIYPKAAFDWRKVTLKRVFQLTGSRWQNPRIIWRDRLIVFRNCGAGAGIFFGFFGSVLTAIYLVARNCRNKIRKRWKQNN
jgi:hypothetical protein